ncbi:hypothetical protein CVO96_06525 [Deinococcus koreensis]|uniref:Uncharacterized protein n=1 Tax=Deinococcus koreensis TaxID=2054903 RepID=A0A2K3UX31_9DEIO|nr:hypothetical protein CVO96_06525 [Deinococcus koreensis]
MGLFTLVTVAQGQTSVALNFTLRVGGACEVRSVELPVVILRCTRGFSPADPHTVLAAGALPTAPLVWMGATPAPDGGTLNEYRVATDIQQIQAPSASPEGWVEYY